jgi:hypothetical protein
MVFSAMLKRGLSFGRLSVTGAAGGGGAYRRTSREGTTASIQPPSSRQAFSETVSNFVLEYTLGADVSMRITPRISALAIARRHQLRDDDRESNGAARRGVSSTVYRAGVGVQWRF